MYKSRLIITRLHCLRGGCAHTPPPPPPAFDIALLYHRRHYQPLLTPSQRTLKHTWPRFLIKSLPIIPPPLALYIDDLAVPPRRSAPAAATACAAIPLTRRQNGEEHLIYTRMTHYYETNHIHILRFMYNLGTHKAYKRCARSLSFFQTT